ncbi:xanthine dehydrogenase family protein molybdopterin-binding subunit [Reyranella sp. MMS21-HV4-11]|uniref:Xanthine dehydrogenase family protein molybdopterin-binding subunit n=1 Tax=Reyranella humidisoli TaxID=2849149 RepID=A0ABS6IQD3_9HYPH|nr:xanthine dehydrogenase family protein molybdopterin-binding subunit [Reyranella sp. MMS21-HV4-11]MBU8876184.1 xanthine dehydrogenase family protein molybdopterin-binding subunit [Reyranella sp. MMS21-HV4-11]
MSSMLKLGESITRREDRRFLTGHGRYAANTAPANALNVLFLRSPHAHAHIAGIDKDPALALPGVAAIFTATDLVADKVGHLPAISELKDEAGNRHREPAHLPMPVGKVRHVGDIVAMIVAETLEQARDAAEALAIDYEVLPAVVTAAQALAPGAPLVHEDVPGNLMCRWGKGDRAATESAFARAAHVSTLSIRSPRQIVHYMETRAAWSSYEAADDLVTVTLSSQGVQIPHRLMCERVLNLPKDKLRLITEDVGGGFGPKYPISAESTLIAWATRKLRLGLRWSCERAELSQSDSHARDLVATADLALDAEGRFLGLRVKAEANYGAYVSMFAPTIPTTGLAKVISGLYRIPAIRVDFDCVFTNTVPVDAIRGAGKPEALFLLERLVDLAAHETGRTPVELRRINLLRFDEMPYAAASGYTYDAADCTRLFETALATADESGFAARRATSEEAGKYRGLGLSCHLHGTGGIADEHVVVNVEADRLVARVGTQSQGQGHETVFGQILSAALGVPVERIEIKQGDTRSIPHGGGTGGSSSTIISGTTLKRAADVVIERGREFAAERLETSPADIAYRDGAFEVVGTDRRVGLFELAAWKPFDGDARFADKIESFPTGVMVCEVEVDPETGETRVDRLIAVADCGPVVNPRLLAGQMHGGIVHGLGNALMEEALYDEESGQLLSGTLMDYALPRADDVPLFQVETIATPSPNNILGFKGVGELPTNGAPAAVANAILDALRPFGVRHIDMPLTAAKVWTALQRRG